MRILYPVELFFTPVSYMPHYMLFLLFFFLFYSLFGWWLTASGYYQGGLSLFVTPHDLHMDLEFEDIVLSVLDRLCLVPYVSPSYLGHVQYHFLRDKVKRSISGG